METRELFIFGAIAILAFAVSIFSVELSSYAFIVGVVVVVFIGYIYYSTLSDTFEQIEYDSIVDDNFIDRASREASFKGEIYLTGEDLFPIRNIGKAKGCLVINEEVEQKETSAVGEVKFVQVNKQQLAFIYREYSLNWVRFMVQKIVPSIPFVNLIIALIPLINRFCFPDSAGLLVPREQVIFKNNDVAEIKGSSLLPLRVKKGSNFWSVVEFKNKSESQRQLESFTFAKQLMKDEVIEDYKRIKNAFDIISKFNPRFKADQEAKLIDTKR